MNKLEAKHLVTRANSAFETSERSNFKNLWDSAANMCRPSDDNILSEGTKGERKNSVERLIDIGINSLDIFTSGITATLIPRGSRFFKFKESKTSKNTDSDALKRWLNDCSKITLDYINESNFFSEISKSFSDLGLIGTSLVVTEPDDIDGIRFKAFYINKFAFMEDSNGRVDTIFFKLEMTARQIKQKFGEDALTAKMKASLNKDTDTSFNIIHAIYPRSDYKTDTINRKKQKYADIYLLEENSAVLLESGFNEMPASVCRWSQTTNELYGRSPAMQCSGNLAMCNAMEFTKLKSAQRIASPQWLVADDGTTRNLNNNSGGIVYWNASNPNAEPKQITPRDMPNITDAYQKQKYAEIEDAFHVPLFNPMSNVSGNTTAKEIDTRVSIAKHSLIPKITRVVDELLEPLFKRVFSILLETGKYPESPEGVKLSDIKVRFVSSSGMLIQQLENAGTLQTVEVLGMLAQIDPSVLDFINLDEVAKNTAESNAVPTEVLRSNYEVNKIRVARAKQQQEQAQRQQEMDLAQAYGATNQAPEAGSPAEQLMKMG